MVLDGGAARLSMEFAAAFLLGQPPEQPVEWTFRTSPSLPRDALALGAAGLSPDMTCWPLRRPSTFRRAVRVGRAASNEIPLLSEDVSKLHAELFVEDSGATTLRDCASANGTWLRGVRLKSDQRYPLTGGEQILFGSVPLIFHSAVSFGALVAANVRQPRG